jgi:hypothetical protein
VAGAHCGGVAKSISDPTAATAATDITGRNRDDMLTNAKIYVDKLL